MSKRELIDAIHELEELSVLVITEGDEAIAEAIDDIGVDED